MGAIANRKLISILGGLLLLVTAAFGWSLTRGSGDKEADASEETAAKAPDPGKTACASKATYARLKEVAFEEAVRARNADPANLDTLASHSVVRMENPVMLSRDEDLNITVCSGRLILELPPGSEAAFGGQRRLAADIEYSAQAAADGSGLVYEVRGAEPIVTRLAAFDLRRPQLPMPAGVPAQGETEYAEAVPERAAPPPPVTAPSAVPAPTPEPRRDEAAPRTAPAPQASPTPSPRAQRSPASEPVERAEAPDPQRRTFSNPSFSCRSARTRGERMVCGSTSLAARDRAMSSMFYSALASANPRTRSELRRTRDKFLAYRDRCSSEACIAEAYGGRMEEIRDIMAAAE
jgi:hypothetical protein